MWDLALVASLKTEEEERDLSYPERMKAVIQAEHTHKNPVSCNYKKKVQKKIRKRK